MECENTGNGSDGLDNELNTSESVPVVTARELMTLLIEQDYKCALTGRLLTPEVASADHIVPVSVGGWHDVRNIQIIHADVNAAKGTMLLEDFVSLCREVAAHFNGK